MRIIDRYLLRQFIQVFVICWLSLTGLYIVFDAFSNLDLFMQQAEEAGGLLPLMGRYYGWRSIGFFDRVSAVLAMIAAMFTVTWIQRHNELTALMAAGISRRRVVRPVIYASIVLCVISAFSREFVVPSLSGELSRDPNDLLGDKGQPFKPRFDHETDIMFQGDQTFASQQRIHKPRFRLPHSLDVHGRTLAALDCTYRPPVDGRPGGYLFQGVTEPAELLSEPSLTLHGRPIVITPASAAEWLSPDQCFVASDVTFDQLSGGFGWRQFASTADLVRGLHNPSLDFGADVRVAVHARIVQPFLDMTLLFLGLPLVLKRGNRNLFVAVGLCGLLVAGFMVLVLASQYLGSILLFSPDFAAWLPLMIFVPTAVFMFDRIEG
jgi:lipopolysaccharide export system permease protein